jgi:hypothetical protein
MSSKLGRIIVVVAPSDDDVFYISATWFLTAGHDDEVIDLAQRPKSRKTHSLRDMERERTYHLLCGPLRRSDLRISGDDPPQKPDRTAAAATVSYWLLLLKDYDVVVVGIITQRPSRMIRPIFPPPIYFQAPLLDAIHSYFFFCFLFPSFPPWTSPSLLSLADVPKTCAEESSFS